MTTNPLPPGTRPGTGGYTAQLPPAAGAVGQSRRIASVNGKQQVEEWYTPVRQQDIIDAVASIDLSGLATESYVDNAVSNYLPLSGGTATGTLQFSVPLNTQQLVKFGGGYLRNDGVCAARAFVQEQENWLWMDHIGATQNATGFWGFSSGTGYQTPSSSDTRLYCGGQGIVSQRNGANPQELQIYEQYTSDSNRSYLSIKAQTGGDFLIEPVGVGVTTRNVSIKSLTSLSFMRSNGVVSAGTFGLLPNQRLALIATNSDAGIYGSPGNGVRIGTSVNATNVIDRLVIDSDGNLSGSHIQNVGSGDSPGFASVALFGALPPTSQPATPTDQAGIIAILQSYGLCA